MEAESDAMAKEIAIRSCDQVSFHLFGPVEVHVDGRPLDVGPLQQRRLLAALLSAGGQTVLRYELVEWVWDDDPDNALQRLAEVTSGLRKRLDMIGLGAALVSKTGWMRLEVPPESVDVHRFRALVGRAGGLDGEQRADLLRTALSLGRGVPLADIRGRRIDSYREVLMREYRAAEISFNRVEVERGNYEERLPDLSRIFSQKPDDGGVAMLYVRALYRAGSTTEALSVYERHRSCLADLGIEVAKALRELQVEILRGEAESDGPPVADGRGSNSTPTRPAPTGSDGGIQFFGPIHSMRDVIETQNNYHGPAGASR
jgi:DNA-binding SARP family transcriptional activator